MTFDDECIRLSERLQTVRSRLSDSLHKKELFGSAYTPPEVTHDIREARSTIQHIKDYLRQRGYRVEDLPEDESTVTAPVVRDDFSSGVEIFDQNPRYQQVRRTPQMEQVIASIGALPCYHIIEAPMSHGKTALVGEIWRIAGAADDVRLAYLFSREHGRTRVSQAVRSLYRQLRTFGLPKTTLPEEDIAITTSVLHNVTRHGARLLMILDGLDECDDVERPLLSQLMPDGVILNVTIVVTLRPVVRHMLLRHLPMSHVLHGIEVSTVAQGVLFHRLDPLNVEDIAYLLRAAGHTTPHPLAERIYHYSQGLPMFSVLYIEQPQMLDDVRAGTQPADAYYDHVLHQITSQCQENLQPMLRQILALLAAAHSSLGVSDIEDLLGAERGDIVALRTFLARYQHLDDSGNLWLDQHFREYLARSDTMSAAVVTANARLTAWTCRFIDSLTLTDVPLYALRHAAEYMATRVDLCRLLARSEWFAEIERRCRSRSTCIEAIKRAQAEIDQQFIGCAGDPAVVNMILCALVRASLSATLLPELVAHLVRLELWSVSEAQDYAENYTSQANRQALLSLLAQPQQPLSFPSGSAVADAAVMLQHYVGLSTAARQAALARWRRDYEQAGGENDVQADYELLQRLIDALSHPPLTEGQRASLFTFDTLLTSLSTYSAPLTGPMSDQSFVDLLTQLSDIWWQLRPRDSHAIWLQPIMATLTRFPRADLLEALELLAPTLRTLFPESIGALCAALSTLGTSFIAE